MMIRLYKKRAWAVIICLLLPVSAFLAQAVLPAPASAQQVDVFLNGKQLSDASAVIESGRVLVPCRALADDLGASITWDEATRTVTMTRDKTTLTMVVDNVNAYQNGDLDVLDVPVMVLNGRSYAPLRFVVEGLGAAVRWDGVNMRAMIDDRYCPVCIHL